MKVNPDNACHYVDYAKFLSNFDDNINRRECLNRAKDIDPSILDIWLIEALTWEEYFEGEYAIQCISKYIEHTEKIIKNTQNVRNREAAKNEVSIS